MLNRQLKEMGIHPLMALIIALIGFSAGTYFIYSKTTYASWVILLVAFLVISKASAAQRVNHLKTIFNLKDFRRIRLIENLILSTPFLVILGINLDLSAFLSLLLLAVLLTLYKSKRSTSFTIPTPFSKQPFEFTSGFRKTILAFMAIYILLGIAITVKNFNLGIFCLLATYFTCLSYYGEPEDRLFVWIFNQKPKGFIYQKIKTSLLFSFLISLPILVTLLVIRPDQYFVISTFTLVGLFAITTMVIVKYAAFPNKMSIPQGIIFSLGVCFPPLLLAIIPYFYSQAKSNLKNIL